MGAAELPSLGDQLRDARLRSGLSLRALAGEVGVSASMISQIETGKSQPSVSTLYAITTALGISIQQVFDDALRETAEQAVGETVPASSVVSALGTARGRRIGPVVRPVDRHGLTLDTGVIWERLGELPPLSVDFLLVTYPPGGTSSSAGGLMRHPGSEFGYLIHGELTLTLGFEEIHLSAGDAISFESTTAHSYRNDGTDPAVGVWFVIEP
jgi:transcriptional regulator with XRE-family HTH domain/quercetin dioxygenase-like cupin family protein